MTTPMGWHRAKWIREMRGGLGNDIQCIKEMPLG